MKGGILKGVDGNGRKVIYIDLEVSENTYFLDNHLGGGFSEFYDKSKIKNDENIQMEENVKKDFTAFMKRLNNI